MEESILNSIKKLLGIDESDHTFDMDLVIHINTALMVANQLGVGKKDFLISGVGESWSDFTDNVAQLEMLKSYVYLKAKKFFDPSQTSTVQNAHEDLMKELEFRLNVSDSFYEYE